MFSLKGSHRYLPVIIKDMTLKIMSRSLSCPVWSSATIRSDLTLIKPPVIWIFLNVQVCLSHKKSPSHKHLTSPAPPANLLWPHSYSSFSLIGQNTCILSVRCMYFSRLNSSLRFQSCQYFPLSYIADCGEDCYLQTLCGIKCRLEIKSACQGWRLYERWAILWNRVTSRQRQERWNLPS